MEAENQHIEYKVQLNDKLEREVVGGIVWLAKG